MYTLLIKKTNIFTRKTHANQFKKLTKYIKLI